MGSARDVGGSDFENTTTIPGPMIRSRHVETEQAGDPDALTALVDQVACPTCGETLPGVATRCPHDGTDLRRPAAGESPDGDT